MSGGCILVYSMVAETKCCKKCGSEQIIRNASNGVGNAKYKCKVCGFGGVFESRRPTEQYKERVVRAAQERSSSPGLSRTFGISHQRALNWIKKKP
jgi:transposase-like protein